MSFNLKVSKVIAPLNDSIKTKHLYVLFNNIINKNLKEHFTIKKQLLFNYNLLKMILSNFPKDIINIILEYLPFNNSSLPSISYDFNPSISIKKIIYLFCNKDFIQENKINEVIQSINYKSVLTTRYPDKYRFTMTQISIIKYAFQIIKENLNKTYNQHPLIYHLQYYLDLFN
tara:strand:+ start:3737 stop:4255 length:519 start_codon:yes stop_codon:yes gene_type:complete